jgi:ribonuclease P protein component
MPDFTLPRSERLRSLKAIRRMFGEGKSGFVYPYRYIYLVHSAEEQAADQKQEQAVEPVVDQKQVVESVAGQKQADERCVNVMFSVPKKFHKRANRRNLLKRRTREAYRLSREAMCEKIAQSGCRVDMAFIYSTKECHTYKTINNAVQRILAQVAEHL